MRSLEFIIFVNNANFCHRIYDNKSKREIDNNFFESSIYKTRIITTDNNDTVDNLINDYFDSNNNSLLTFKNLSLIDQFNILDNIHKDIIIDIYFNSLFKLLKLSKHQKSLIRNELLINLKPGDIINVNDLLEHNKSHINVDSPLVDIKNYSLIPMVSYIYTDCLENEKIDESKNKKFNKFLYDHVDIFDKIVQQKYYGVDRKYLNNNYKCLKITLCNVFNVLELKNPVVSVNEDKSYRKNYIFNNNNNDIIRYKNSNATHYITKAEKGNCLFQAFMYPVASNVDAKMNHENIESLLNFVRMGKIISASNNRSLENWMENFIHNHPLTLDSSLGLINFIENKIDLFSVWNKLYNNQALIYLRLRPLN
ncbi:uncharacterized protein PF3D7_0210200-like [Microplitis mediator]|uniref:uncharacterized protein PF3D7_0210200-like n=1 Tax=Microplitis mediator TaxID=375433 RepID=UPI002552217D|nr:uncharacterized protein PF3D7_0210200-like [Microplitis mediator]